jgi:hypothetical protein
MHIRGLIVTSILAVLLMAGCSKKEEPQVSPLTGNEISGERLGERIFAEAPYETYAFWPGHEDVQLGQAPHGIFHRIYANRDLYVSLPRENNTAPYGSIIVKENLNSEKELLKITVMAKVEGFDPENGDWFWGVYTPDGVEEMSGKLGGCITCHEGMADNDYVIVQRLDETLQ